MLDRVDSEFGRATRELRGIFVVGCGRAVGTTVVCAGLLQSLQKRGERVAAYKPVETGCALGASAEQVDGVPGLLDEHARGAYRRLTALLGAPPVTISASTGRENLAPRDGAFLGGLLGETLELDTISPYRFAPEVAPILAARLAEQSIELGVLLERAVALGTGGRVLVVDGGGAFYEPWGEGLSSAALAAALGFPVLVVGTTERESVAGVLGLAELVRGRGLSLAGVVLSRRGNRPDPAEAATPFAIELVAGDVICGVLPRLGSGEGEVGLALGADWHRRFEVHLSLERIWRAIGARAEEAASALGEGPRDEA